MKQMTLIEMDGFLKGKCIPRDLKVNETNSEYLVRKFGELESKLETALRECRSAGITIDNLEAKWAALLDELDKWRQESSAWQAVAEKQLALAADAEKRISELEAREVVPDEMTPKQASRSYCGEVRGYRDGWNACRAAMLHGSEPETDNTNQQFESLSRDDK